MKPTVGALKFAMLGNTAGSCAIGTPSRAAEEQVMAAPAVIRISLLYSL